MVTRADAKESRIPTLGDLVQLCRWLNERKAKYIVIGGMAVLQHGFLRATEDIDLLVETSKENEKAVIAALSLLADGAAKELVPGDIEKYEVIRISDEIVVDLMSRACGIKYDDTTDHIAVIPIDGVEIPFADLSLLIRLKQGVRPKDQMDLSFLEEKLKEKKGR